jgi:catechol 2,3-dioxygenase-like lactoylglutathione lyase family enzyme
MQLTKLHQVAAGSRDLDETARFYGDVLGARFMGRFDPPGLLFFGFAGTRLLFEKGGPKSTLYFWVDDIDAAHSDLAAKGVAFDSAPHRIHRDDAGQFGPPGDEEWMAFFKDPSGNTLALATQRPPR